MKKIVVSIQVVEIVEEVKTKKTLFEQFKDEEEQYYLDVNNAINALNEMKTSLTTLANEYVDSLNATIGANLWRFKHFTTTKINGQEYLHTTIDLNSYYSHDVNSHIDFMIPIKRVEKVGYNQYYAPLDNYDGIDVKVRFQYFGRNINKGIDVTYDNVSYFENNEDFIHTTLKLLYIKLFKDLN